MMTPEAFGRILVSSGDLDPIYIILHKSGMTQIELERWLVAYWCYYHAGVASYITEGKARGFWERMWEAQPNFPRGMERRHFRGGASIKALKSLESMNGFYATNIRKAPPESIIAGLTFDLRFQEVNRRVQEYDCFGPWIAWKVADMLERVAGYPIDFSNASLGVYRDPVMGAALIRFGDKHHPITNCELEEEIAKVIASLVKHTAPPSHDRPINIQEAETVLCKYKAYVGGHYPPGKDTHDIYHALEGWGDLAQQLQQHLPAQPLAWRV